MRAQRVTDLGIRNLELLFAPLGLPLVHKNDDEIGTTSILLRGEAGTGKTTLAVALAHAVARHGRGSVLYLTTGQGAEDVSFKASLLGLDEAIVRAWEDRTDAAAGSILVRRLPVLASQDARLTSADRSHSAISAIREMLMDDDSTPGERASIPIRAVVIDSIGPPDSAAADASRCADLASLIQELEARGVSAVIVEEASAASATERLSFVVDLVLSPGFRADGETGELHRKLTCRQSRYARALPGPHDYGLDPETQRPIVWPDLLAVVSAEKDLPFAVPKARHARMLMPIASDGEHMVLQGGSVIINESDATGTTFVDALRFTPGVRVVEWRCGYLTSVQTKQKRVEIFAGAGPHALGDAVVRALRDATANTVVIHGMETLLELTRFQGPLLRIIETLRALGVLTCIHGKAKALRRLEGMADVIVDDSRRGARRTISDLRYRPSAMWLPDLTRADLLAWKGGDLNPASREEAKTLARIQGSLARAGDAMKMGDTQAAVGALKEITRDPSRFPGWSNALAGACFVATLARYRAGAADLDPYESYLSPMERSGELVPPLMEDMPPELNVPLAWTYALMGRDAEAARACYEACDGEVPNASALLPLWWSLNALYAQSSAAVEALAIVRGKPEGRFTLGFHLRALARRGRFDEADSVTEASREAYNLKDYFVSRLQADARLESSEPATLADAKTRLALLWTNDRLPTLHRAEVAHNLAYAHEQLGEPDDAVRWYRRALEVNPYLELASKALTRLGDLDAPREPQDDAPGDSSPRPRD